MKINSRFNDFYDYSDSCSRTDTVVYNREYKEYSLFTQHHYRRNEADKQYLPVDFQFNYDDGSLYVLLIGDIQININLKVNKNKSFFSRNTFMHNFTNELVTEYCEVLKELKYSELPERDKSIYYRPDFHHHCSIIHFAEHFGISQGKVIIPLAIKHAMIAENMEVTFTNNNLRNTLKIQAPVALVDYSSIQCHLTACIKVFENISLVNSGFLELIGTEPFDTTAGAIDNFVCSRDRIDISSEVIIANKDKIQSNGFDNKISFRNRKVK